jgi:hypothetical protein
MATTKPASNPEQWPEESKRFPDMFNACSLSGAYIMLRIFVAIFYVIATITTLALHVSQVQISSVCMQKDPWSDSCLASSGLYRSLNFTSNTFYYSFQATADVYGGQPVPVKWDTVSTTGFRSSTCGTELAAIGADKSVQNKCESTRIRNIYEIPADKKSYTLAGGVHIIFFLWVSLHISTAFAIFYLPPSGTLGKFIVLPMWYIIGFGMIITVFFDDTYFDMHVPFNNIFLSIVLEIMMIGLHFIWARNSSAIESNAEQNAIEHPPPAVNPRSVPEYSAPDMPTQASQFRSATKKDSLSSLMNLSTFAGPMRVGRNTEFGPQYTPMTTLKTSLYHGDVFEQKWANYSLLEMFYMELALTMPLDFLAIFSVAVRTTSDWSIQSYFVRIFLICSTLAIVEKVRSLAWDERNNTLSRTRIAPLVILVTSIVVIMFGFLCRSFIYPYIEVFYVTANVDLGFYGVKLFSLFYFALFVTLVSFISMYNMVGALYDLFGATDSSASSRFRMYTAWAMLFTFLMLFIKVVIVTYMIQPRTWYPAFNPHDVTLAYVS